MGTITLPYTFVAGQTPTQTQWNSNPTTIATLVNGQIDKANVDSSGSDGIVTMDEAQTISGAKTFSGAVISTGGVTIKDVGNAAGSIQTNLTLEWDPGDGEDLTDNSSGVGIQFVLPDDAANQTVFASLDVMCLDDAASSEDGEFSFKTVVNASEVEVLTLSGNAATFTVPITVGVNGTGHDVMFFGDTSGAHMLWDESANDLKLVGAAGLTVAGDTTLNDAFVADGKSLVIGNTANIHSADLEMHESAAANLNVYFSEWSTNTTKRAVINLTKSASATIGTAAETADGERLGDISFHGRAQDDALDAAVTIRVTQDGTSGATATPGRFSVMTATNAAAPVERLRVDTAGDTHTNDGSIAALSDSAAKRDVSQFTDGLNIISRLSPINYKFNGVYSMGPDDGIPRIGFAAEDVAKVAPYLTKQIKEPVYGDDVDEDGERVVIRRDDVFTLNQIKMIPLLVNVAKELDIRLAVLEAA